MRHPLLEKTQSFIESEALFTKSDRLLIAVSGGMDSCCLVEVLLALGYQIGLVHYNFQLRGADSDADAEFVGKLARKHHLFFDYQSSNAATFAAKQGLSIQMAARNLRYAYFLKILAKEGFDYLLTAHHLDDSLETYLLNFSRGTGIAGLGGIPSKTTVYRRPFLGTDRATILDYAQQINLQWREDNSNAADKYQRNFLRHHVLPKLKTLQPELLKVSQQNFRRIKAAEHYYLLGIQASLKSLKTTEGHLLRRQLPDDPLLADTLLFEALKPHAFTPEQRRQIRTAKAGTKLNTADGTQVILTEEEIRIYPSQQESIAVNAAKQVAALPCKLALSANRTLTLQLVEKPGEWPGSDTIQYLNYQQEQLPLKVRKWMAGDRFQPFGMGGKTQKLQDFFVNQKLDAYEKEQVWLLCDCNDQILWVIGWRLSELARVLPSNHKCIQAVIHVREST